MQLLQHPFIKDRAKPLYEFHFGSLETKTRFKRSTSDPGLLEPQKVINSFFLFHYFPNVFEIVLNVKDNAETTEKVQD
jgi:hypothetical protein